MILKLTLHYTFSLKTNKALWIFLVVSRCIHPPLLSPGIFFMLILVLWVREWGWEGQSGKGGVKEYICLYKFLECQHKYMEVWLKEWILLCTCPFLPIWALLSVCVCEIGWNNTMRLVVVIELTNYFLSWESCQREEELPQMVRDPHWHQDILPLHH